MQEFRGLTKFTTAPTPQFVEQYEMQLFGINRFSCGVDISRILHPFECFRKNLQNQTESLLSSQGTN